MIKSWLEWTTVTCCVFFIRFLFDGFRLKSDECEKMAKLKQIVRRHGCTSAARNDWMLWQDLDVLLNFSPDSLSLFLILHDVSLSHSVYGSHTLSLFHVLLLLSSSNSCIVLILWGHTISSLCTFCVRSALEELVTICSGFSSSFLLYTAPCREIFSCFLPISLSACRLELLSRLDVSRWSFSLSPVSVFLLLWWGERFYFHRSFTLPWKCYTSC